jgi:HlyD family secretion protein
MKHGRQTRLRVPLIGLLALLVTGCSALPWASTPEGTEEVAPLEPVASVVSATGEVRPVTWTTLSFETSGQVVDLLVEEGEQVEEGDVIARLDGADLEAELNQNEAALALAEANLAEAKAGPREEEVAAAKQALAAANARTAAAAARRDALYSQITEAQIEEAEHAVYQAQQDLEDLQGAMGGLLAWAEEYGDRWEAGDKRNRLSAGEMLAYQIELAELELAAAQAHLDDLLDGPDPDLVRIENARIWIASAQAQVEQARLDLLMAGPLPQNVAVSEAKVDQAKADIELIKARMGQLELTAPFAGTVTEVFIDANEFTNAGQAIDQIGDLSSLRIETTDLNEIDVARVKLGDKVIVTFDALPGVEVDGKVIRIAPKAEEGTGVNYTVVIEPQDLPDAIRWGMTAFVDIEVE